MLTPQGVLVGVAVVWLIETLALIGLVVVGVIRRRRGQRLGRDFDRSLAVLGGGQLGLLFLVGGDAVTRITLAAFVGWFAVIAWRRGRRTDAGCLVAGAALPWTLLWATYLWALMNAWNDFDVPATVAGLAAGFAPFSIGLVVASRGDRASPQLPGSSHHWAPGSRTFGTLAAALRSTTRIGPFGAQELAAVIGIVVVQVPIGFAMALARVPVAIQVVVLAVLAAAVGTEAYIRALTGPARRAFETFSWAGERELARLRAQTGEGVPVTKAKAEAWLARHPDRPELRWIRAELQLLAGHLDEGLRTAELIPEPTPRARVERLATIGMARWLAGEDIDLEDLETAVADVPAGTEDRLEAEVVLASARTRIRMADGRTEPGDANQPLVEARRLLGHRADGQVGRAFRRRLFPLFLAISLLFGLLQVTMGSFAGLGS